MEKIPDFGARFHTAVRNQLDGIAASQAPVVARVADWAYASLADGGVMHAFGTGHSVTSAMEMFHRAGGLVPVHGILVPEMSPFARPVLAAAAERDPNTGGVLADLADFRPGEVLILFSQSGINAVPIDLARAAQGQGARTVAVTARAHSEAVSPRHPSGKRLFEVADAVIDNGGRPGDAVVEWGPEERCAATSGIAGAFIANWIVAEIVARYIRDGLRPPVYRSANVPGGDEHNRELEARYADRIPALRR